MNQTITELINDFRSYPCNDRERRIVDHLEGVELETYCILRNTGSTVTEALESFEFDSRDDALKLAKPGNVIWCEKFPARGRYFHRYKITSEDARPGGFWIKWQTVDAWEVPE
jgi:hypothetical protein